MASGHVHSINTRPAQRERRAGYPMSDPSITVAEAFKQFSQVAVSALRAYEHGSRARLTQAEDDLRVLRHERDDSIRDLNACKEQSRAWLAEMNRWKAEADSALVVNRHQAELIAQLRQEAQQWKDQCLRLEESLRGEIKSWKDQFLRVDAERTRILDQLQSSSSSQTTLAVHTPKHVPILAAGNSSATSSATKRCASASSSTARADKPLSPTKALAFPRVVRRVQAVIEVPVKVEEGEEDGEANRIDWPDSTAPQHTSTPSGGTSTSAGGRGGGGTRGSAKRRKSSASSHQRRSILAPPSDDERKWISLDLGEEQPYEAEEGEWNDGSGECVDEEEVENAIVNGTPSGPTTTGSGRKTIPWGRKHIRHQPDEEDDELMMYAKLQDNTHRVRPQHGNDEPWLPPRKSNTDVTAPQRLSATTNNAPPAPKRRTTETGGSSARTKRRR